MKAPRFFDTLLARRGAAEFSSRGCRAPFGVTLPRGPGSPGKEVLSCRASV